MEQQVDVDDLHTRRWTQKDTQLLKAHDWKNSELYDETFRYLYICQTNNDRKKQLLSVKK